MKRFYFLVIFSDDLDISPDFFEYFAATFPILHADPTLWCVSAWNDNGKVNMVADDPGLFIKLIIAASIYSTGKRSFYLCSCGVCVCVCVCVSTP